MIIRNAALAILLLAGCGSSPVAIDAGDADASIAIDTGPRRDAATVLLDPAPEANLTHTFPAIDLPSGAERLDLCQAWTLNNDDPIYVNSITMDADPGWHHSNWMWVPDDQFLGDDGTFACSDRDFNELVAGLHGGGVFFAQSTQSTHEVQAFQPGAAYLIPAHARVIGSIHVFNLAAEAISTALTFTVHGAASQDVQTLLYGLALDNRNIAIAPHSTTTVEMSCNMAIATRAHRLVQRVHYVLPHYHGLATGWQLFAVGGPHDGELIYGTSTGIGDPLGDTLAEPFDLSGAEGLRLACTYENPNADAVEWGLHRTDEMCMVLAYVDGGQEFGGQSNGAVTTTAMSDGTTQETSPCITIAH